VAHAATLILNCCRRRCAATHLNPTVRCLPNCAECSLEMYLAKLKGAFNMNRMAEKMAKPFQEALEIQHAIEHMMQGDQQRRELKVPGISAAVILPDGTTWLGVSGRSSETEAMHSDMLFGLASVATQFPKSRADC
jgi:hypothetical protein